MTKPMKPWKLEPGEYMICGEFCHEIAVCPDFMGQIKLMARGRQDSFHNDWKSVFVECAGLERFRRREEHETLLGLEAAVLEAVERWGAAITESLKQRTEARFSEFPAVVGSSANGLTNAP